MQNSTLFNRLFKLGRKGGAKGLALLRPFFQLPMFLGTNLYGLSKLGGKFLLR